MRQQFQQKPPHSEQEKAIRQIEFFENRFGEPHLIFACHAAFPLAVTVDMLYDLWANFQQDIQDRTLEIPWIAVADLVVSGFLPEVGFEIYQMERNVRQLLLQRLRTDQRFGPKRIDQLAQFLLAYIQPQLASQDSEQRDFALAQKWAALAYIKPTQAARQLARVYQGSLPSGTELVRMQSLIETLADPLEAYQPLIIYARSLGDFARGNVEQATSQLKTVAQMGNTVEVAGVQLQIPKPLQTPQRWTRRKMLRTAGWLALAGTGATTAVISHRRYQPRSRPDTLPTPTNLNLQSFEFAVPTVNVQGQIIQQVTGQAESFIQDLGEGVSLEMVSIPGGSFVMGAPPEEKGSDNTERPQHEVTVQPFFMGKYQVTQVQWRVIASLPKIQRDLNPNPSFFNGDDHPVERVSWQDTVEFCARLSELIEENYAYRLPSEAEWEYACRARTQTPFHFGPTITGDLANYRASEVYAQESPGQYRRETTPVGSFQVANAFGLYDMHGNVWEWCADPWHDSYNGAPSDGRVWDEEISENDNRYQIYSNEHLVNFLESDRSRLLRGGSWVSYPELCRSAVRGSSYPGRDDLNNFGFRVACSVPK